jgi:hypothetical protein
VLWWLLTAAVYRQAASNFLRAESGWFLFLSHSAPEVRHGFEKALLTKNFWGHYTPVAFVAEFETARMAGTNGGFWKWRQITLLSLLATTLFLFARNSGVALGLTSVQASVSAGALTALLIFQTQMREFITWPFMIMQLFWLLFSLFALICLVRVAQHPVEAKWPWLAAAFGYASLHFLGLGIATVGGTAVALTGIWLVRRKGNAPPAAKIASPLFSLIALAGLHAIAMQRFMRVEPLIPASPPEPGAFLAQSLGFIPNFAFAALRRLFLTTQTVPHAQINRDWPYGLAILLGILLLVSLAFFRAAREPTVRNQSRFVLRSFASVSFLATVALVSIRQWFEPSPNGFSDYLVGSRHLVPASFALVGILMELFLLVALLPVVPGAIVNLGVGIYAVVAHLQFAAHIYPKVAPQAMIPHERAWHSIVAMTRECQSAGLAIPNVPLGELTQEFADWDLKLFEPLLRSDLKLPPETNLEIVPWSDFANASPDNYSRQVPSLAQVRKRLHLDAQIR